LFRTPGSLPYAAVPVLCFVVLSALGMWASIEFLLPAFARMLPDAADGGLRGFFVSAASWLLTLLAAAAGVFVALLLAPVLSAPALEHLVSMAEAELAVPPRAPIGFWGEVGAGLRASLCGLLVFGPLLAALALLDLAFPPAAVVTVPLRFGFGSLWLAYTLFDYPQSLRGYPARRRLRLLRRGFLPALGFGLGCSVLFWFPCVTLLVLPVGVVAATELFWKIQNAFPDP
jgi:uncharacterized protein involved in cysteine biosynthesis